MAAIDGSVEFYKQMMVKLDDMNKENIFGDNHPLIAAAGYGQLEICKHIIGELEDKNPARFDGVTPLSVAAHRGHYEVCKFIMANADDKNPATPNGVTPLYLAAQNGQYEICKLIITNVDDKNPAMND